MLRSRRELAAILSIALAVGNIPVRAAELAVGMPVEFSAPAPILSLHAPLAAPILSVSAAASAPISSPVFAPAVLSAVPALRSAAPQAPSARGAAPSSISSPVDALEAGRVFDGTRAAPSMGDEPVRADASAAAARLERPKAARARTTGGRLLVAAAAGAGAASLAPLLWSAAPAAGALSLFAAAASPVAVAAVLWLSARAVRGAYRRLSGSAPPRAVAAPSRGRVLATWAAGAALGAALTAGTALEQRPILEGAHAYMDSRLPAREREVRSEIPGTFFADETARVLAGSAAGRGALARVGGRMPSFYVTQRRPSVEALPGTFFSDETARILSRDSVGREVLDGLRDRGGVLRMPVFFVSYQTGSTARYTPPDTVYLSVQSIEAGGVSVAEFMRNPAAQAAFIEREQAVIVHELTHADQARRSPFNADTWTLLRTDGARLITPIEDAAASEPARPAAAVKSAAPPVGMTAAPVSLDAAELARSGLTVERFLRDGQAQRDYILGHQAELARALKLSPAAASPAKPAAAVAAPVAPVIHADLGMIQEWEYEAYLTEHFYTHARLSADPAADIPADELQGYMRALVGFDDFLRSIDGTEIYAANFHGGSPYYAKYMAGMRARWDAHRVEAYVQLARRALSRHDAAAARAFYREARGLALEKGLAAAVLPLIGGN